MEDEDNVMRSLDMSEGKSSNILRESIKELEEKMLRQSREAMQKIQSYEFQIQSVQRKIEPLDELANLKLGANSSIVENLSNKIANMLENRFNKIFTATYLDKTTFEKYQTESEEKSQQFKEDIQDVKSGLLDFRGDSVRVIGDLQSQISKIFEAQNQIRDDLELKSTIAFVKGLFATKDEVLEVNKQFQNFTPLKRFQNYIVTMNEELGQRDAIIENMLDKQNQVFKLIESTKSEINVTYVTQDKFNDFSFSQNFTNTQVSKDIMSLQKFSEKHEEDIETLEKNLMLRAHQTEVIKLWENFPNYCSYEDLKDLYSKVLPPLAQFENKMNFMSIGYEQSKEMIRRYDEIISDKANKVSIQELHQYVNDTFQKQAPYNEQFQETTKKIDKLFINLSDLKDTLQVITDGITKDIHQAVRKATNQMKTQLHNNLGSNSNTSFGTLSNVGSGIGLDPIELKRLLIQKVDKNDMDKYMLLKSNKSDMEQALKSIDILHKQVCHQIVLFIELVKTSIQPKGHQENQKTKEQRKIFILQQAISVCRWINTFDPENINNEDLYLPPELRTLQEHSRSLVSDFPKLDHTAEIAMKKFRVKDVSALKNETQSLNASLRHPSPKNDKELVSQQLDKYITMSLTASRGNKKEIRSRQNNAKSLIRNGNRYQLLGLNNTRLQLNDQSPLGGTSSYINHQESNMSHNNTLDKIHLSLVSSQDSSFGIGKGSIQGAISGNRNISPLNLPSLR